MSIKQELVNRCNDSAIHGALRHVTEKAIHNFLLITLKRLRGDEGVFRD